MPVEIKLRYMFTSTQFISPLTFKLFSFHGSLILENFNFVMESRLRRKTSTHHEESPRKKRREEKTFVIGEKIL